jgi:hypothetical protein
MNKTIAGLQQYQSNKQKDQYVGALIQLAFVIGVVVTFIVY